MLVTLDETNQALNGIGFRMETPESANTSIGIHDFYHAQLIQRFSPKQFSDKLQTKCLNWLPGSQPSFPLPANCPVTLLLCLIVTLYGRKCYTNICGRIPGIEQYRNKLAELMGKKRTRKK